MQKIGVLCSGNLGFEVMKQIFNSYKVEFVLTDNKSKDIITFLGLHEIPFFAGNPRKGKGYLFVKNFNIDIIISVNYLFIIEKDIINHPKKLAFNLHGSLLPKNRGRTPHVWSIINGENKTGITAHIIDEGCDTGDILGQIEVEIKENDTGATILDKYKSLYFPLIKNIILGCKNNTLEFIPQKNSMASYNGKRTPEDGQINWYWSSVRIRNWIRAQAYPYPGAFTFYENQKVIIDKVELIKNNDFEKIKPGTIVSNTPNILVKTIDGVVLLHTLRAKNCTFELGQTFYYENSK